MENEYFIDEQTFKIRKITTQCSRSEAWIKKNTSKKLSEDSQKYLSVFSWNSNHEKDKDLDTRLKGQHTLMQKWSQNRSALICLQEPQRHIQTKKGQEDQTFRNIESFFKRSKRAWYYPNFQKIVDYNTQIFSSRKAVFYQVLQKKPNTVNGVQNKPFLISKIKYPNIFNIRDKDTKEIKSQIQILIFSLHLRATFNQYNRKYYRKIRTKQLKIIRKIEQYQHQQLRADLIILAGDFNIGDNTKKFPQNKKLIRRYHDSVLLYPSNKNVPLKKLITKKQTLYYDKQRFDRVILREKNNQNQNQILDNLYIRTCKILANGDKCGWLSDHAAVFVQFAKK